MKVFGRIWCKLSKKQRMQQLEAVAKKSVVWNTKQIGRDYFISVIEHV